MTRTRDEPHLRRGDAPFERLQPRTLRDHSSGWESLAPPPRAGTAALLWLTLASACSSAAPARPDVTVTDSAGVAVVENGRGALERAARWALEEEPSLEIAGSEADGVILFRIGGVTALPGGRIAVSKGGPPEVLVFDRQGRLLQRVGGAGDGPGEFVRTGPAFPLGDSLGVYDSARRRLSMFGPSGELVGEVSLQDHAGEGLTGLLPLAGGDFVFFVLPGFDGRQGVYRNEAEWLRVSTRGEVLASYGRFPGTELMVVAGMAGSLLFGARTHATTAGDLLVVGTGEGPELRHYGPEGALVRIVRWPDHERSVGPEALEAFLAVALAEVPREEHAAARQMLAQLPRAERAPPWEDLIPGEDGDVWVGDYTAPMSALPEAPLPARRWLVFDSSGVVRARVETPAGFRPHAVHQGEVLGVFQGALAVESVRAYRVVRGGG